MEKTDQFTVHGLASGFRAGIPIALGAASYGLVFGVLSGQAGLDPFQAFFMSGIVFAGASQFVALDMWQYPLPWFSLILTTFVVNLRHVLMGAVMADKLKSLSPFQAYGSLFFMVDENFAYSMNRWKKGDTNTALLAGTGVCLFLFWTSSTLAGRLLGTGGLDPVTWGIDFSFTAIFIFLATGLWQGRRDLLPWITAAVVAVLAARFLPGKWYILIGSLCGSLVGVLNHER